MERSYGTEKIHKKELNSFIPPNFGGNVFTHTLGTALSKLLGLHKLEHVYHELASSKDIHDFISHALSMLGVSYSVAQEDLQRIPQEGPIIVVANHSYGGLDGLILSDILLSRRTDVKVMANYLLGCVHNLREFFLLVDPYARATSSQNNLNALKKALTLLRSGGALGVFPSGDVAHLRFYPSGIHEGAWSTSIARLVKHTNATIVPVHFTGGNGALFHVLGLLHPRMRTAMLPRQMTNKHGRQIHVEIGRAIPASRLASLGSDERCMRYLRMRNLLLHRRIEKAKFEPKLFPLKMKTRQAKLIPPVPKESLAMEIRNLPTHQILFENGEFSVVHAQAEQIPLIMKEISRLREQAFRLVGEGTGKKCDTDKFDAYYTQLFLWNRNQNEIAGAYRLAHSDEILQRLGQSGMYTATFFKLDPNFFKHLGPALEMGRSFICPKYQKNYVSLLSLWKGISAYILKFPKYKTLFGPVSISHDYKKASRQLMAAFFESRNPEKELAKLVTPRTPFRCPAWVHALTQNMPDDEAELVSMIEDIDANKGLPVLIRQYLKLGGSILRFNLDPDFSNALDGLIVIDLLKTNKKQLERYMGKGIEEFLAYHHQQEQEYLDSFKLVSSEA